MLTFCLLCVLFVQIMFSFYPRDAS